MKNNELDILLQAAFEVDDFDPDLHQKILERLKAADAETLSLKTRFQLTNYLQSAAVYLAKVNDYKTASPLRKNDFVVDESKLPDEVSLLLKINETLQYSDKLADHFVGARRQFLASLTENPVFANETPWQEATTEEKLHLLESFIRRSVETHNPFDTQNSSVAQSAPDPYPGLYAYAEQEVKHTDGKYHNEATVSFSRDLLEDPSSAVKLAYHESVHIAMQLIGLALENGEIPPEHPLYEDARIKLAHMESGQRAMPVLSSFYKEENEERVAYREQKKLEEAILTSTPS